MDCWISMGRVERVVGGEDDGDVVAMVDGW